MIVALVRKPADPSVQSHSRKQLDYPILTPRRIRTKSDLRIFVVTSPNQSRLGKIYLHKPSEAMRTSLVTNNTGVGHHGKCRPV